VALLKWELIENEGPEFITAVHRSAVPGGWLVVTQTYDHYNSESSEPAEGDTPPMPVGCGLTFVPDPDHTWDGNTCVPTPPVNLGGCNFEHPGCDNSGLCKRAPGHKGEHQCGQCNGTW
jgi:hypothetical protein